MARTPLLFFVTSLGDDWIVLSEDQRYGPFARYRDALCCAVDEAGAARACGFASAVLHTSPTGSPGIREPAPIEWMH